MMKQFHICHIILRLDVGGLERVLINLINTMPNNFKHSIICLEIATDFGKLLNKQVDIIELEKLPGREFKTHRKIFFWLLKNKPEVVQTYNLPAVEYQSLAWLARVPLRIHAEHGREVDDIDGLNRKRNLLRKISLPFATKVVSVSNDLTNWLKDTLKIKAEKIIFIANGIDTNVFCYKNVTPYEFVIGAVGRIDDVKNHELLIRLGKYLRENEPSIFEDITIEIIGDGPGLSKMRALVASEKLDDKILFLGKSFNIVEKLNTFSLFLQPSKYEAMPMTVLEAMACRLPVIASNVGGIPKVINHGKNGLLFEANSLEALAERVIYLYHNENKRTYLAANAREDAVRNYSCKAMAENYKKLYESVN
ncbi:glycosyltransferase [Colwellia sp. BRX10-6]|jgi:sugar transferase (PEP-CTERM/EpsH1 system associated)|uniref:glycosyltransferase n=1 Tax=unclassified Colwellia TaxID=196834 RepID=UPI0015F5ED9A|nr:MULTISPECIES: glycosyltransferase [unclassified Colwellia]MBA6381801.1 glycosyltransferase [Colwellia sp. BRX10-9]MBA6393518.1 glycosyltransferase [Colwellia sp. BRX10-6]